MKRILFAMVFFATASSPVLKASPVTWYLSNVIFSDGGMGAGSFTYDATTHQYRAINISTSGGLLPPTTYTSDLLAFTGPGALDLTNGLRSWLLSFSSALFGTGGTVALSSLSGEVNLRPIQGRTASGFVTTAGVAPLTDSPEPGEVSLVVIGGAFLFLGRKKFRVS